MSDNHSSYEQAMPLDAIIDGLFGKGLGYSDWEREITEQGYKWSDGMKNRIISRELDYFRVEILYLKGLENTAAKGKCNPRTNSLESVLRRMKGEIWLEGVPDEKKKRLRNRRLLGKDAKIRNLQNYVKKWEEEALSAPYEGPAARGMTANIAESHVQASTSPHGGIAPFLNPLPNSTSNSDHRAADMSTNSTWKGASDSNGAPTMQATGHMQAATLDPRVLSLTGCPQPSTLPSGATSSIASARSYSSAPPSDTSNDPSFYDPPSGSGNDIQGYQAQGYWTSLIKSDHELRSN